MHYGTFIDLSGLLRRRHDYYVAALDESAFRA